MTNEYRDESLSWDEQLYAWGITDVEDTAGGKMGRVTAERYGIARAGLEAEGYVVRCADDGDIYWERSSLGYDR